jgi:phosphopantetheinyl transferase
VPLRIDPSEPLWEGPDRERIYKQMFHTGLFRVLDGVPYVGGDTIVAYGGRPEGDLTKGAPGVELQTDPLVTEMAFQAAGLWGMIERGQSLLPLSIGRLRYFEGLGAGGGPVVLRVRVRQADDKGLCVDAEVRAADGRLLQALEEYRMVAHRAVPAAERLERGARWQLRRMSLSAREIGGWLHRLGKPGLEILTQAEQGQGTRFRRQQHRDEWLASRLAAKLLCRDYLRDFWGLSLPLGQIEIAHRIGGEPFARLVVGPRPLPDEDVALPPLSLSHSDGRAVVVLASPGYRLRPGVDLERVEPRSEAFVQSYFHTDELSLAVPGALRRDEKVTALWTIKEAVSKALGTGLRASTFEVLVRAIEPDGWARVELLGKAAQAFGELLGTELRVRVSLEFGFVTAEAYLLCRDGAGPTAAPEPSGLAAAAALLYHKGLI